MTECIQRTNVWKRCFLSSEDKGCKAEVWSRQDLRNQFTLVAVRLEKLDIVFCKRVLKLEVE